MPVVIRIVRAENGTRTPHDGRFLVAWNPHQPYGTLAVTSTDDISKARRFSGVFRAISDARTISRVQPRRPDGLPNRPLSALTFEVVPVEE